MDKLGLLLTIGSFLAAGSATQLQDASLRTVRLFPRGLPSRADGLLDTRQVSPAPPTTTTPICDQFDNYFYVTPRNYTWQLQCTTNFEGAVIQQVASNGYGDCIVACANYNRANGAGSCIAITFNGPDDQSTGLCTQFSEVSTVQLADEEGNIQDSALLVTGPNGTVFATPRPEPSFSGQPSQPPTVDPLPSTTISGQSTTIVFTTSVIFSTSCPPGIPSCPLGPTSTTSISLPSALSTPDSAPTSLPSSPPIVLASSSSLTVSLSNGGTRPGLPSISITTVPSNSVSIQVTFTSVVVYTIYEVEAVVICPQTPGPCTQTSTIEARTGLRTQLSCSPGTCTGIGIATDAVADLAAATCIETA